MFCFRGEKPITIQSSSRPLGYTSFRRPNPTILDPHISAFDFVAASIILAIASQSSRTCASLIAPRNAATDAPLCFVFNSAIRPPCANPSVPPQLCPPCRGALQRVPVLTYKGHGIAVPVFLFLSVTKQNSPTPCQFLPAPEPHRLYSLRSLAKPQALPPQSVSKMQR